MLSLLAFVCVLIGTNAIVTNITITDKLTVWLYAPNIARITTLPDQVLQSPQATSRIVTYVPPSAIPYTTSNPDTNTVVIKTSSLQISCNKQTNLVTFYDASDTNMKTPILAETNKTFTQITDTALNAPTYTVLQEWMIQESTNGLYGWGEYQNGFTNYIGSTVRCEPFNTEACVPMVITNSGYGIYWDNLGVSILNSIKMNASTMQISEGYGPSLAERYYGQSDEEYEQMQDPMACTWQNISIPLTGSNVDGDRTFWLEFAPWNSFGIYLFFFCLIVWDGFDSNFLI